MQCSGHPARTFPSLTHWLPVPFQRSPNGFPILRGGFHHYFLHLVRDQPLCQHLQLLRLASEPEALELVFVVDFDIRHYHGELLFMYIDSRYPIHRCPPGGSGEHAGTCISQGRGLSPFPQGERQRSIYSLDWARSRSNTYSASTAPMS